MGVHKGKPLNGPPPLDDRPAAGAEMRRRGLEAQIRAPKWAYTRGNP